MLGKLILFYQSGAIDVKIHGPVFEEINFLSSSKLDWASNIVLIVKIASRTIAALVHSMKFLSPEVALNLYKSNLPQGQAWNIFVMSGVVLIC